MQALPSLQDAPFGASGSEQRPVDGLHVPATWHWSSAAQTTPAHELAQGAQEPPQSRPVSVPFWTPSLQVGAV